MNSPVCLNYEIRPCKFAERKMLLASFLHIINRIGKSYQYIGFGGLSFTDFKLFHKELNIDTMYSIEGGDFTSEKLYCNKPYSYINVIKGMSTSVLPTLDMSKPSIIWLDYDDTMSMTIFNDINLIFNSISAGSIFVVSCNRELKNNNRPLTNAELREMYNDLTPFNLETNCCTPENAPKTIRTMIENYCKTIINERNRIDQSKLHFFPLYNIIYSEYRGARMFTYGGIVLDESMDFDSLNVNKFDFINTDSPYVITIPNVTHRESLILNQVLGNEEEETNLISKKIISEEDLKNYKKFYKYMPNFYDVRL